jgi:hypothetical protein
MLSLNIDDVECAGQPVAVPVDMKVDRGVFSYRPEAGFKTTTL